MNSMDLLSSPITWVAASLGGVWAYREVALKVGDYYGQPGWTGRWMQPITIQVACPDMAKANAIIDGVDDVIASFLGQLKIYRSGQILDTMAPDVLTPGIILVSCLPTEDVGVDNDGVKRLGWTTVQRLYDNGEYVPDTETTREPLKIHAARCRIRWDADHNRQRASTRHEICHALGNGKHDKYSWSPMGVNVVNRQLTPRDVRTTMKGY